MSPGKKEPHTGTFLGVPYDWRRQGFKARLKERFGLDHATIEIERGVCADDEPVPANGEVA